ncbi:MAG: methyl-accepting chemotaxis protein, partial [Oscillospiraceae bacterium]|nr:methyl-accepting chemotaxis protein [Oscillospiraceae bacterium]
AAAHALLALSEEAATDRALGDSIMLNILGDNPAFSSIFTEWNPDAFDGLDDLFRNTYGTDPSGRYLTWYYREGAEIVLADYGDVEDESDLLPSILAAGGGLVSEPYLEERDNGDTVVLTSIMSPVWRDGAIVGVVGMDLLLEDVGALVGTIHPYETGYARLISSEGVFVAHEESDQLLTPAELPEDVLSALASGEPFIRRADNLFEVYCPVPVAGVVTAPWVLQVNIPIDKATQSATAQRDQLILIFALAFLLVFGLLFLLASTVSRPLRKLTIAAKELAAGHTQNDIDLYGRDEAGQLADAYRAIQTTIHRLVAQVNDMGRRISGGDLSARMDAASYSGEYAQVATEMNGILRFIHELVSHIRQAAVTVSGSSRDISESAQSLAQGSTEQAAAIERISTTVSDATGQAENNSEGARKARGLVDQMQTQVEDGHKQMGQLLTAVEEINEASQSVSQIMKAIEDIAFQTNLLALNAAVEAARAGAHGKGFAVVADEVKNLANKSARAAQKTGDILSTSIEKAGSGVTLAHKTQASLTEIQASLAQVVGVIGNMSDASLAQSSAMRELGSVIGQINSTVQGNAAAAEQSAAASHEMEGQSRQLSAIVEGYQLGQDERAV